MLERKIADDFRILFIGNSYTLYHEVPKILEKMSEGNSSLKIETEMIAIGGHHLEKHWQDGVASNRIKEGNFTHVVIQELSTGPLHNHRRFIKYATLFARLAKEHKVIPLFYLTWARQQDHEIYRSFWSGGSPEKMLEKLNQRYSSLGKKEGISIVPVGLSWQKVILDQENNIHLFDEDGHHASFFGAYLSAASFYVTLTEEKPPLFEIDQINREEMEYLNQKALDAWVSYQKEEKVSFLASIFKNIASWI